MQFVGKLDTAEFQFASGSIITGQWQENATLITSEALASSFFSPPQPATKLIATAEANSADNIFFIFQCNLSLLYCLHSFFPLTVNDYNIKARM